MLKHKLKNLVKDRAPTKYPKSVVTVLMEILHTTFVPDWKTSDAELCYSRARSISKWAFHTNLQWATVDRAIKLLTRDGVIKMNPSFEGSYAVLPSALTLLESKFRNTTAKQLERKILKAVRMKFQRDPNRSIKPWSDVHPEQCLCEPRFCSHPSAI